MVDPRPVDAAAEHMLGDRVDTPTRDQPQGELMCMSVRQHELWADHLPERGSALRNREGIRRQFAERDRGLVCGRIERVERVPCRPASRMRNARWSLAVWAGTVRRASSSSKSEPNADGVAATASSWRPAAYIRRSTWNQRKPPPWE